MGFFTDEIAIDLGTANTLIIHKDKVVVNSPSIVAIDRRTNKVIAIGQEANMMQGKTHENIRTVRPLKDGVIADFNASEQMINSLIKSIPSLNRRFFFSFPTNGHLHPLRNYRSRDAGGKRIRRASQW